MNELVSEIYLIRQLETEFAKQLRPVMFDLGAFRAESDPFFDGDWTRDRHLFHVSTHKTWKRRNEVEFSNFRYDPKLTDMEYGKAIEISKDTDSKDNYARTYDNSNSPEPTTQTFSETITLHRGVEHSFQQHYAFEMSSKTTVKGSYMGVEVEQELSATFGTAFDDTQTKSESTDVEKMIQQDLVVPAGKKLLVTVEYNKIITETPFTVNGCLDFDLIVNFENWASQDHKNGNLLFSKQHYGDKKFTFNSIREFQQFLNGYDVDYPEMIDYPNRASDDAKRAMDWIFDPKNRMIQASGTKRRTFENNITIRTQEAA